MTTPNGTPTGANPVRPRGFQHADAAAQASPTGGGQFTGGGEAKVLGANQDQSPTGGAEARAAVGTMKTARANEPSATVPQFTKEI